MDPLAQTTLDAVEKIRPYLLQTPIEYSPWLSRETGAEVFLKMEHLQVTGSFKLRGAAYKLLTLTPEEQRRGIITASTGNHGAAVAYMADQLGIHATIFLPENVSETKVAQLSLYQVQLRYHGHDAVEAEYLARQTAQRENRPFISPYNDWAVMAGQGTLAVELQQQLPDLDVVWVPVGGGGLISGVATHYKTQQPEVQIIGCQPIRSAVMYESIRAGRILDLPSEPTLSDGTAGGLEPDSLTFEPCGRYVDQWVLLSEEEIKAGLRFLLEKHYLLVEGAAALTVAALRQQGRRFEGKRVALILCGRKLGLQQLREILD